MTESPHQSLFLKNSHSYFANLETIDATIIIIVAVYFNHCDHSLNQSQTTPSHLEKSNLIVNLDFYFIFYSIH